MLHNRLPFRRSVCSFQPAEREPALDARVAATRARFINSELFLSLSIFARPRIFADHLVIDLHGVVLQLESGEVGQVGSDVRLSLGEEAGLHVVHRVHLPGHVEIAAEDVRVHAVVVVHALANAVVPRLERLDDAWQSPDRRTAKQCTAIARLSDIARIKRTNHTHVQQCTASAVAVLVGARCDSGITAAAAGGRRAAARVRVLVSLYLHRAVSSLL